MAEIEYGSNSMYFDTPIVQNQYLGVMVDRPIPKLIDDLSFTINETYNLRPDVLAFDLYGDAALWWVFAQRNPDQLEDPIYDFKPGVTIQLPKASNISSDLGV